VNRAELRQRLARIVAEASEHAVTAEQAAAAPDLNLIGVTSLATLRIIDTVESELDVDLDLAECSAALRNVDELADYLAPALVAEPGERNG
jgi:acyl carrier protein